MKKLLFLLVCLTAMVGCKQEKAKIDADVALQTRDSLNRIIAQRDNEINDMMATMRLTRDSGRSTRHRDVSTLPKLVRVLMTRHESARTSSLFSQRCSRTVSSSRNSRSS